MLKIVSLQTQSQQNNCYIRQSFKFQMEILLGKNFDKYDYYISTVLLSGFESSFMRSFNFSYSCCTAGLFKSLTHYSLRVISGHFPIGFFNPSTINLGTFNMNQLTISYENVFIDLQQHPTYTFKIVNQVLINQYNCLYSIRRKASSYQL